MVALHTEKDNYHSVDSIQDSLPRYSI